MAAKLDYEVLKRSLTGYQSHLTRVCDANASLADLSATVGPVAARELQKGLDQLDKKLEALDDHISLMLQTCAAKDYDLVEEQREKA